MLKQFQFENSFLIILIYQIQKMFGEEDVLGRQDQLGAIYTRSLRRAQMKISHLEDYNKQLQLQVEISRKRILKLDELIDNLTEFKAKKQKMQRLKLTENGQMIEQIIIENKELFYKLQEVIEENQELINQKLITEQIHEQSITQYEVIIDKYEKKIHQLRLCLQIKQGYIRDIQPLIKKDVALQIPATKIINTTFFDKYLEPYVQTIQNLYEIIKKLNPSHLNEQFLLGAKRLIEMNKSRLIKEQDRRKSFFQKSYLSDFRANRESDQPNNQLEINQIGLYYFNNYLQLKKIQKQLYKERSNISKLKVKQKIFKQSNEALSNKVKQLTNQLINIKAKCQIENQNNKNNNISQDQKKSKQVTAETISSFQYQMNELKCRKNNFKEFSCSIVLARNNNQQLKKCDKDDVSSGQFQKRIQNQNQNKNYYEVQSSSFDLREEYQSQQADKSINFNQQSGFLSNNYDIHQQGQIKNQRRKKAAQHFIQEKLFD